MTTLENALVEARSMAHNAIPHLTVAALELSVLHTPAHALRAASSLREARARLHGALMRLDSVLLELAVAEADEVLP